MFNKTYCSNIYTGHLWSKHSYARKMKTRSASSNCLVVPRPNLMTYGDTAFCETLHRPQFETLKVLMCLSDHYNTSVQNCFQRMTASS